LLPFHCFHHGFFLFCWRGHSRRTDRNERAGRYVLPDLHTLDRRGMGTRDWANRIDRRPDLWRHHALAALAADHYLPGRSHSLIRGKRGHLSDGPYPSARKREGSPRCSRILNFHRFLKIAFPCHSDLQPCLSVRLTPDKFIIGTSSALGNREILGFWV